MFGHVSRAISGKLPKPFARSVPAALCMVHLCPGRVCTSAGLALAGAQQRLAAAQGLAAWGGATGRQLSAPVLVGTGRNDKRPTVALRGPNRAYE